MQSLDYRIPKDDHRNEAYRPISSTQLNVALAVITAVLTLASFIVVFQGANDEPYMGYRRSDAIVQVGVGTALMVLWACCAVAIVILAAGRKLSAWWLLLLLWAAVCLFYLKDAPLGYLQDIENVVLSGGAGTAVRRTSAPTTNPTAAAGE